MNRFNKIINSNIYHRGGVISKLLYRLVKLYYHCDIPYSCRFRNVYFDHKGFGVVINPDAVISEGTEIQHSVTIGETTYGCPKIGKNVYIGARAVIIGKISIGDNARIGAGAVVISNIPANSTAVGIPAKIVKTLPM